MEFSIPLKRVGTYALDEFERAITGVSSGSPAAPGGGAYAKLREAEISIAFATADGSEALPAIVLVSELPLPTQHLRELLERWDIPVHVTRGQVSTAPRRSIGRLVLRVAF
jgi:hypothetical protein